MNPQPQTEKLPESLDRRLANRVLLILLCATLLNYANRFAFTQNALQIQEAFGIGEAGYGEVAGSFSAGFACGGLFFGIVADMANIRWLYPLVVAAWSIAGFATGLVDDLEHLRGWQFALGLLEAGHWPCALRTTQRLFLPAQRTWANSILQSGASLGAVLTPQLVLLLYWWDAQQWRWTFFLVGGCGAFWVFAWLWNVGSATLVRPVMQTDEDARGAGKTEELQETTLLKIFCGRRWWLLLAMVICINTLWHYIRVWMPVMLEKDHQYSHEFVQHFTSVYYLATFLGSIASGAATLWLLRRNWNVLRARMAVFLVFALLSSLAVPAAFMPRGPALLAALLCVAFGSLGLFPIYYSMTQEISARNQGKVGGTLGFSTWSVLYFLHPAIGGVVENHPRLSDLATAAPWTAFLEQWLGAAVRTRSCILAAAGLAPLAAWAIVTLFWGKRSRL